MPPAKSTSVRRKVIGVDQYSWLGDTLPSRKRPQRHTAVRGEIIEISKDEAERGEGIVDVTSGLPALGPVNADVPKAPEFTPLTEDQLLGLDVEQLVAYLGQVPEDLHDEIRDHIVNLELDRDIEDQRATVLAFAPDYVPAEGDEAADPTSTPTTT